MPTYTEKIPIPDDPVKLMDLGMKIYARHCIMGEKSPLQNLQSSSWEENGHEVNNALRLHELIEEESLSKEYSIVRDDLITRIKASTLASLTFISQVLLLHSLSRSVTVYALANETSHVTMTAKCHSLGL